MNAEALEQLAKQAEDRSHRCGSSDRVKYEAKAEVYRELAALLKETEQPYQDPATL